MLVIVVVLGALAAMAMFGVSSMTDSNDKVAEIVGAGTTASSAPRGSGSGGSVVGATAACAASAAGAQAATSVYFVNSGGSYPVKWSDLTSANPSNFALPADVVINPANPAELDGNGWKLMMAGGGTSAPTFTCP